MSCPNSYRERTLIARWSHRETVSKRLPVRGMRLLLNAPTDYALHEGEFVPLVRFNLDGHELAAEGEIRFVGHVRGGPRTRQESRQVGVEFLNVSPGFEQRVQQYVQRRDRELLRDSRG